MDNAVENLINSFNCLNIKFDEGPIIGGNNGPYFQSRRLPIYNNHIKVLLDKGSAYPCFCSADRLENMRNKLAADKKTIKYDRHCQRLSKEDKINRMKTEQYVLRMKVPDKEEVVFSTREVLKRYLEEFEKYSKEEILNQRKEKFLSIGKQKTITFFSKKSSWVSKSNFYEHTKNFVLKFKKEIAIAITLIFAGIIFLI